MTRPVNKNNPKNIKCEHCEFFEVYRTSPLEEYDTCINKDSPNYLTNVNYWNRCKCFKWHSKYDKM